MRTTLNEIRKYYPCQSGWKKLLNSLGKTSVDDEPVSFKYILESNGIQDAIWCLKTLEYKEICLFCADVADLALPFFENKYPDDDRPRKAIEGIRLYKSDEITLDDLKDLRAAAYAAAYATAAAAAAAADAAAYATAAADAAAYATAAADDAAAATSAAYARKEQWKKIEKLFVKYFCD